MGQTTIRIPDELLERAEWLVAAVDKRRDLISYARLSRAAVVRLALARGLDVLEAELRPVLEALDAETEAIGANLERHQREWAGLPPAELEGGTDGK